MECTTHTTIVGALEQPQILPTREAQGRRRAAATADASRSARMAHVGAVPKAWPAGGDYGACCLSKLFIAETERRQITTQFHPSVHT